MSYWTQLTGGLSAKATEEACAPALAALAHMRAKAIAAALTRAEAAAQGKRGVESYLRHHGGNAAVELARDLADELAGRANCHMDVGELRELLPDPPDANTAIALIDLLIIAIERITDATITLTVGGALAAAYFNPAPPY